MTPRSRGDGGKISRRAAIALIGGGGLLGLTGTGAFDTVDANRPFSVATGEDDNALLSFEKKQTSGLDGSRIELIELTNRAGQDLDTVSAVIVGSPGPIKSITAPDSLASDGSDSSGYITAQLSCGGRPTVDIRITASGSSQEIDLTRSVEVNCIDICDRRTIPAGCVDNVIPQRGGNTSCSVKINSQKQYRNTISNVTIGGALDISNSGNQVTITINGDTVISDYLRIDTPDQIDFSLGDGAEVQNGAKFVTESQITPLDIDGTINGGICIESGGVNTLSSDGGNITGPVSIDSSSQVQIKKLTDASMKTIDISSQGQVQMKNINTSLIDGDINIDSPGSQVQIGNINNTMVAGNIDISSDSQVQINNIRGTTVAGNIDVSSDSKVQINNIRGTTVAGNIDISSDSQVTISLKRDAEITGNVNITSDSKVTISLKQNARIKGDVTIDTPSGVTLDCSNIEGQVTTTGSPNPC